MREKKFPYEQLFFIFLISFLLPRFVIDETRKVQFQVNYLGKEEVIYQQPKDQKIVDKKEEKEIEEPVQVKKEDNDFDVDLVYTYVDGSDPNWQKKKQETQARFGFSVDGNLNKARFINFEEIRYSLRSAELYVPWVRKIFIITDEQTIPYIKSDHPKIVYIDHKQILPKYALPNYNSFAIEEGIVNIPGLSNNFLYLNDDFFFSRPANKSDFFDLKEKVPIINVIHNEWKNLHQKYYKYTRDRNRNDGDAVNFWATMYFTMSSFHNRTGIYPSGEIPHGVFPCSVDLLRKMNEIFPKEISGTLNSHFRDYRNIQLQPGAMLTCLANKKLCKINELKKEDDYVKFFYFTGNSNPFINVNHLKYRTVCINSGTWAPSTYSQNAKNWLLSWLPNKSSFEKD
ncbi:Stealth protein CR4, conserved region 4 [Histomonas meleagridis]|uniref:Stealth protein CR4, conserved region 4 n=1 Tax=Histomonas meleagridis TaxID=135588 RepID=UPI00355A700C|nr:Stealth protein CR4, conserved region 4 [Histomonas meleagridis]KAH0796677.1 Stealth protein CR4, conserved region 4 [Histomonas meleagridis]